jgi:taurine---2-oxoglutarate transaminase
MTQPVVYGWQPQRTPVPARFVSGKGVYLWDDSGRRFMDFGSGQINVNVGYSHPKILDAMQQQMSRVTYVAPSFETEARNQLAARIVERMPESLEHVFFTNSGSEAIDTAIKIARAVTGRLKIYSAARSYHGNTLGSSALSGDPRRLFAEPALSGVARFHGPACYSCAFGPLEPPRCGFVCLESLRHSLLLDGPETVAAIVLEAVVGTSGLYVAPAEFVQGVRDLCDEFGILLILDETLTGWGRTGRWFAYEHYCVRPDILTTAKGITSGYVPLGAVVMSRSIFEYFSDRPFVAGSTHEGHALACAAGVANMQVYEGEGLIERSQALGEYLFELLMSVKMRHPCVGDVRGKGLFACLELTRDRPTRAPIAGYRDRFGNVSSALIRRLFAMNLIVLAKWDFVFVAPPLVITREQLEEGVNAIDRALTAVDELI